MTPARSSRPLDERKRPLWDRLRFVLPRSAVLAALKSGVLPDRAAPDSRRRQLGVLEEPSGEWLLAWRVTTALIARFAGDARARAVPLVIVIAPDACQVYADSCDDAAQLHESRVPQRLLAEAASREGSLVVDLLPVLRDRATEQSRLYFRQDLHWTARGHSLAAETTAEAIRRALRR